MGSAKLVLEKTNLIEFDTLTKKELNLRQKKKIEIECGSRQQLAKCLNSACHN